jgi:hypothetical protein
MPKETIIPIPMPPGSGPGSNHHLKRFAQYTEAFPIGDIAEFEYNSDGHLFAFDPTGCFEPPIPPSGGHHKSDPHDAHTAVRAGIVILIYIYNNNTSVDTLTLTVS